MIRILAVHQGGGVGGAPVSLLKLLAALDATEFETRAIFTEPGAVLDYAHQLGVNTSMVPTGGAFFYSAHARLEARGLARFLRTFPSAVRLARATLRETRPDLVHLNTSVLVAWAAAARRERVPVVWVVREVLGPNPAVRAWHARFIERHARRIVAISKAVRSCFPNATDLVYNAVDLVEFSPTPAPETNRIALVGSVQRAKGHWLALDALARLRKTPNARLVLVTGGVGAGYADSARGRVKRALGMPLDNLDALLRDARRLGIEDQLEITGFRRDVAAVLAAVDVVLFPSLAPEGFGRPIIEAMAMARPVVATDIGPSREILGPDAGLLVAADARALAGAIGDLLAAPELRRQMGRAGRARVEECFGLERQVAAMSDIYRHV